MSRAAAFSEPTEDDESSWQAAQPTHCCSSQVGSGQAQRPVTGKQQSVPAVVVTPAFPLGRQAFTGTSFPPHFGVSISALRCLSS